MTLSNPENQLAPQSETPQSTSRQQLGRPGKTGLYDPANEKDNCGIGFVANIKGEPSHQIIMDAERVLRHMDHRGGCGCDANTGDGAGMLTGLPYSFLRKVAQRDLGIELPEDGKYGVGNIFLPHDETQRYLCKQSVENIIEEQGQTLLGWRKMPVDAKGANVGKTAMLSEPHIEQLFIGAAEGLDQEALERQLFLIAKRSSNKIHFEGIADETKFYMCSLSTKVIIYKGMLTSEQVFKYYIDLHDPDFESHLAMVHSRFSTNTFPSWDRAQPCRFMSHNGEINTLRGNVNWLTARQGVMKSELFGEELQKIFPICDPTCSDSGNFDNALEMLLHAGREIPEAMMMMIPEAWQNHHNFSEEKRAFYEYHSAIQEPWDGPASICFTDGKYIGATLDRNGLRPSRFYVTHDDKVIMASEVGVLDVEPKNVKIKGRLQPGKMFLVDFEAQRIISDDELKHDYATRRPYTEWLKNQRITLNELPQQEVTPDYDTNELLNRMQSFGYSIETLQFMLMPMIRTVKDPLGSMGDDAALAILSDQPRMSYDYFKQLFAQVTNPPIDSTREEIIMSLECFIGPEGNLLETTEEQCHRLLIPHPILSKPELASLKALDHRGWKTKTIDMTFDRSEGPDGIKTTIDRICQEAEQAITDGYNLVLLSDRNVGQDRVAVSALLATGALHHYLVRNQLRTRIGIVVETGEAREVHHFCLLTGFGADAINPYLAIEALIQAREDGLLEESYTDARIVERYRKATKQGILKVMAKMGISTLQSYKGAQIFEAVGLNEEVIEKCFRGTASRIKGIGFDVLADEAIRRHNLGFPERAENRLPILPNPGLYAWRKKGENHSWNPFTISEIQNAARTGDKNAYARFSKLVNEESTRQCQLRGLLKFKTGTPVPIEEVEPAAEIVKRFCTGAMSYGSISAEAHETLAIAMNRLGGKSNTGEGGEDYARFEPMENGDSKRSAIKQIASGRFGVTSYYLTNADELQIKMAQGAKPGEGGELPGHKVNKIIAATRHSTPGVGLISPPPHHDIYSIEDLSQLIFDLKNANPTARVSVKLVSEVGVGTIAAGVAKGKADNILIAGHDGGTGASPLTSVKHAGLPWELGLSETHQTLVMNDLRSRVRIQTDGQLKTGRDVVMATLLGAEEYGFATAPLITMGCIMMRKCHLNTCPVGIATQDPELRKKFEGKPEHVVNYLFLVAEECRQIMAELGFRTINEMVGRVDMLETNTAIDHWKARGLDFSAVLAPAQPPHENVDTYCTMSQDHGLDEVLDNKAIEKSWVAINEGTPVEFPIEIENLDRAFGTMLSHHISKKWGAEGLPKDTIRINLRGSAGQSLGAWGVSGITFNLEGDANDFVGKGLCGAKIIIRPHDNCTFVPEENILLGNVALYGATEGEAYFRGIAAERFCVRNSGAKTVVEGVGDHALEYMTGGRAVIIGPTGRNLAAGMSGGIAYIYDPDEKLLENCNMQMVELEAMAEEECIAELRELLENHYRYTGSTVAKNILDNWNTELPKFKKVMPVDYKRALKELAAETAAG